MKLLVCKHRFVSKDVQNIFHVNWRRIVYWSEKCPSIKLSNHRVKSNSKKRILNEANICELTLAETLSSMGMKLPAIDIKFRILYHDDSLWYSFLSLQTIDANLQAYEKKKNIEGIAFYQMIRDRINDSNYMFHISIDFDSSFKNNPKTDNKTGIYINLKELRRDTFQAVNNVLNLNLS